MMVVRTNVLALNSHRNLGLVGNNQARASQRLSSGFRVNSAADDAAGLAISEGMRAQIRGMNQAGRNVHDGINLIQVADGALSTIHEMMQRMRELAIQSANDTYSPIQREMIDQEFRHLRTEIDRIVRYTQFNGTRPLMGIDTEPVHNVVKGFTGISERQIFVNAPVVDVTVTVPAPNLTPPAPPNVSPASEPAIPYLPDPATPLPPTAPTPPAAGTGTAITDINDIINTYSSYDSATGVRTINAGNFQISAADFAFLRSQDGGNNIFLADGARLQVAGPLTGANAVNGVFNINGHADAHGFVIIGDIGGTGDLTIGADLRAQITGNSTKAIVNNGNLTVGGTTATVTNHGNMSATSVTTVAANSGNLTVSGTISTIQGNTGALRANAAGSVANSGAGVVHILTNATSITANSGTGRIFIAGGITGVGTSNNNGNLHVGANVSGTVNNQLNGRMFVFGTTNNVSNAGHFTANNSITTITNNTGIMRANDNVTNATNGVGGQLHVFGSVLGLTTNSGRMLVNQNANAVTNNAGGNLYVVQNVNGNLNNMGNMRVSGNAAGATNTNSGHLWIQGNAMGITTNNGSGRLHIEGNAGTVNNNASAHVRVVGTINFMNNNAQAALAILENATGTTIFNAGHMQADQTTPETRVTENTTTGRLLIPAGTGSTGVRIDVNSGWVQAPIDNVSIGINNSTGRVQIDGDNATVTTNAGQLRIIGEDATVGTNTATGQLRIDGDNAAITTNSGQAHIVGNDARVTTNAAGGSLRLIGNDAIIGINNGTVVSDGSDNTITTNSGYAHMFGDNATIGTNTAAGRVRFEGGNATLENNHGRVEVSGTSTITSLGTNHGTGMILVENGGRIGGENARTGTNYGTIHVAVQARIYILENQADHIAEITGTIISHGSSEMDLNRGYLQVGIWSGDALTPPGGSAEGRASVEINDSGIIRNFSANLFVEENISGPFVGQVGGGQIGGCQCTPEHDVVQELTGGRIENYGTMNTDTYNQSGPDHITGEILPPGEVRHHARQIDSRGINAAGEGAQILEFYANGEPHTISGVWVEGPGAGGRRLVFEGVNYYPSNFENNPHSWLVFNAGPNLEVPGTHYDVRNSREMARPSMPVAGSHGTSGRYLVYEIHRPFMLQAGANTQDVVEIRFRAVNTEFLGGPAPCAHNLNLSTVVNRPSASCAMGVLDAAITQISEYRAELGAMQNRLEFTVENLGIAEENLSASESRIRDADMALEMMRLTAANVLQQAATAMLAQANQAPQTVLQLLG
jgi:flagellin-like hook-associated protein FlgL